MKKSGHFSKAITEENTQRGTGTNSGNPKVKFLNIVDDIKYPSIASKIQKVDGGNIAIMSAENINNPAIISLKKSPIESSIERPFQPGNVSRVSSVVRLPNQRKEKSPKSDKKRSLPPNKRIKGRVLKKKEEFKSQPTLSEFLE